MKRVSRALASLLVGVSIVAARSALADVTSTIAGSHGQQAIAARASAAGVVAHVCSGACGPDGGVPIAVPDDAKPFLEKAKSAVIDLPEGRHLLRIDVPGAGDEAWVLMIAAPLVSKPSEPVLLWSGWINR